MLWRSVIAKSYPRRANSRAVALPMPPAAPVMSTTGLSLAIAHLDDRRQRVALDDRRKRPQHRDHPGVHRGDGHGRVPEHIDDLAQRLAGLDDLAELKR